MSATVLCCHVLVYTPLAVNTTMSEAIVPPFPQSVIALGIGVREKLVVTRLLSST